MTDRNSPQPTGLYELLLVFISFASVAAIVLLSWQKFSTIPVLAWGAVGTLLYLFVFRVRCLSWPRRPSRLEGFALMLIAVVAISLRRHPYPHHIGGQDQGLYVSLAETYRWAHGFDIPLEFRKSLAPDELKLYEENDGPGPHNSGVVPLSAKLSLYQMPFYPLHPAWMAIFADALGRDHGGCSLIVFALLGIVGLALLVGEISGSRLAAYIAAALVAIGPGFVFFTKFPVSELVALAFSANGFFYLALAARFQRERKPSARYWVLSVLLLNGFFYTRMSFATYLPFLGLCFAYLFGIEGNLKSRIRIAVYFLAVFALFCLSWYFYYREIPDLFEAISLVFTRPLGKTQAQRFGVVGASFAVAAALTLWDLRFQRLGAWIKGRPQTLRKGVRGFFWLAILVLFAQGIYLVLHGIKDGTPWEIEPGTIVFSKSVFYKLILYFSPLGFAALAWGVARSEMLFQSAGFYLLLLFTSFQMLISYQHEYIAYAYYADRYLVSEVVPYGLAIIAIVLAALWNRYPIKRKFLGLGSVFMGAYFLFFSVPLFEKIEGSYPQGFLDLAKDAGPDTLLLISDFGLHRATALRTPLIFFYRFNLFPLRNLDQLTRPEVRKLASRYARVLLLAPMEHVPEQLPKFEFRRLVMYREGFWVNGVHPWTGGAKDLPPWRMFLFPMEYLTSKADFGVYDVTPSYRP